MVRSSTLDEGDPGFVPDPSRIKRADPVGDSDSVDDGEIRPSDVPRWAASGARLGVVPEEALVHPSGVTHPSSPAAPGGPPQAVLDVVTACPLPSLLLAIPSEEVVAASGTARRLLCPDGGSPVGRGFEEFTVDGPTGALELVVQGSLDGYEARRTLRRGGRAVPLTVWVRGVGGPQRRTHALAKLLVDPAALGGALPRPEGAGAAAVVGSTDGHLTVDRVSTDVVALLDHPATDVVGQSLLRLVDTADVAPLLEALARSTGSGLGTSLVVRMQLSGSRPSRRRLLLLPMEPSPSFAFAVLDVAPRDPLTSAPGMREALWGFDEAVRAASSSRRAGALPADRGLGDLSGRELEIVLRLLDGDRVPAIAESLFLSSSTVRNHLSAVFRKLRVGSQQELIHLLRRTDGVSMSS
ncbi:hypothetical protein ASG36_02755 [Geodermatophilus sp. Leaf369]|nr:hypothetical protein ASG36_02755 [Geodermatophilus sp. Leaf369]